MTTKYYLIISSPGGAIYSILFEELSLAYKYIVDNNLQLGYYTIIIGDKLV